MLLSLTGALLCLMGMAHAATSAATNVIHKSDGSLDMRAINVCVSEKGNFFKRRDDGALCRKGDLVYINLAFDSDAAGDAAEKYCDFKKGQPDEAEEAYGVLCYLRVTPPGPDAHAGH
jgi:hypothetical protein